MKKQFIAIGLLLVGVVLFGAEIKTQEYYEKNIEEAKKTLLDCDTSIEWDNKQMECVNALLAFESNEKKKK